MWNILQFNAQKNPTIHLLSQAKKSCITLKKSPIIPSQKSRLAKYWYYAWLDSALETRLFLLLSTLVLQIIFLTIEICFSSTQNTSMNLRQRLGKRLQLMITRMLTLKWLIFWVISIHWQSPIWAGYIDLVTIYWAPYF